MDGKTLLIFDVDGTLADTSLIHEAAFNEIMAPWKVTVNYGVIAGMTTEAALRLLLEGAGSAFTRADIEELAQQKRNVARRLLPQTGFVPGAGEFLCFAQRHYRMAACSSGSRPTVDMTLRHLGIDRMFDMIVTCEDVVLPKPEPDGLLLILRTLGVPVQEALVFEDAVAGVEASLRGGVDVIQISPTNDLPPITGAIQRSDWPRLLMAFQEHKP